VYKRRNNTQNNKKYGINKTENKYTKQEKHKKDVKKPFKIFLKTSELITEEGAFL